MSTSSVRARWTLPLVLVAAMVAGAPPAAAQTAPPKPASGDAAQTQADALFTEGRDLLEKGRFPEACAKLARSEQLSPAVGTLLNLAYCYEQVGQLRSAMDAYSKAETLANAAGEAKRAAFARERFAAVEPRAPKLVVRVVPPEPPGLEIKRNAATLAAAERAHPIAVDPQDYVITASAPGYLTWKTALLVRGEGALVTVIVPPLEPVSGPATASAAPAFGPRRIAAVGLGVASALAIGASVGVGLAAKSRYDDSSAHCDATGCDATGASIQQGAVTQANVATGLAVFGALCGAAGVYLWFVGAPEAKKPAQAVRVDASPLGASLGGRF